MTRDDIIRLAREAGFVRVVATNADGSLTTTVAPIKELERFATLVAAAEREKVAKWMISKGYSTGHGDTTEDLLKELEWQIREQEREACAKVCDVQIASGALTELEKYRAGFIADAIRARGETTEGRL